MPDDIVDQNADATAKSVEQLPDWAQKEITSLRREAADKRVELRSTKEQLEAVLEQNVALTGEKESTTAKVTDLEKDFLKYKVAVGSGVSLDNIDKFAARLQGDDETALRADAADLLAAFGGPVQNKQNATDPSQGHGDGESGLSEGAAFLSRSLRGR